MVADRECTTFAPPVLDICVWPGGVMVRAMDLRLRRSRVRLPVLRFHLSIGQVVHTHVPLSPISIIGTDQGAVMPCCWEGNRRFGVALAMRHRLQWFIHLRIDGLRKGDEPPPTLLMMGYDTLYLFLPGRLPPCLTLTLNTNPITLNCDPN